MSALLTEAEGGVLVDLAAAVVAAQLSGHPLDPTAPEAPALRERGATFVTLTAGRRLRGCVGSLEPVRPRYRDVVHNAGRAMRDPRLPAVTAADWPALEVHVSVLSKPEPVAAGTREDLLATLRPGVDGLVLAAGGRRVTFLPSVWHQLTTAERFLAALLAKGGWPAGSWPASLAAHRYTTAEFATYPAQRTGG